MQIRRRTDQHEARNSLENIHLITTSLSLEMRKKQQENQTLAKTLMYAKQRFKKAQTTAQRELKVAGK